MKKKWYKDKEWWAMAFERALRTCAQSAIALIGTEAVMMSDVNWLHVLSGGVFGAILSVLTSVAFGVPEYGKESK